MSASAAWGIDGGPVARFPRAVATSSPTVRRRTPDAEVGERYHR